jgi:hypothetical protein
MNKEEEQELKSLIDYLDGELNAEDHQKMEQKLEADEVLQAKLNAEIEQIEAIRLDAHEDIKRHLKDLESKEPLNKDTLKKEPKLISLRSHKFKGVLWAAASVALLISLYTVWPKNTLSTLELYQEYYETYPNFSPVIQRGAEIDPIELNEEETAMLAYEKSDFNRAEELLKTLYQKNGQIQIGFYLAQSLQENDKTAEAITIYTSLLKKDSDLEPQIYWYKALAHLKLDEKDMAKKDLKKLTLYKSTYSKKAEELINKLNL